MTIRCDLLSPGSTFYNKMELRVGGDVTMYDMVQVNHIEKRRVFFPNGDVNIADGKIVKRLNLPYRAMSSNPD